MTRHHRLRHLLCAALLLALSGCGGADEGAVFFEVDVRQPSPGPLRDLLMGLDAVKPTLVVTISDGDRKKIYKEQIYPGIQYWDLVKDGTTVTYVSKVPGPFIARFEVFKDSAKNPLNNLRISGEASSAIRIGEIDGAKVLLTVRKP